MGSVPGCVAFDVGLFLLFSYVTLMAFFQQCMFIVKMRVVDDCHGCSVGSGV